MSETIEKNQDSDNDITKTNDKSTWDLAIKHIRVELNECLSLVPLAEVDPDDLLSLLKRLKSLVRTLGKLAAAYDMLGELREIVLENQNQEQP